jgi:hypothetical protein
VRSALLLLTLWPALCLGQSVTLPKEVKGEPGAWVVVVPESKDGGEVKWKVGKGLTLVPIDKLFPGQKSAGVVVQGPRGRYEVWAWNAKGDVASDLAVTTVVIGDVPPGPDPGPGPTPPDPPTPATGKRALIVYESAKKTEMPEKQLQILYSARVQDYLRANTDLDADGKTRTCGAFDPDDNLERYSPHLARMMKEPRSSLPWVVLEGPGGVFRGPLPADPDAFLALAKKHLEGK